MATGNDNRYSMRDVLNVVFLHKFSVAAVWFGVVAAVVALSFLAQEVFVSEAKLLIRVGRENISLDPSVSGPIVGMQQSRENEIKSELAILTSRYLADQVVATAGAENLLGPPSEKSAPADPAALQALAANRVMAGLTVVAEKGTNIINVSFDAHSPEAARNLLDTLLQRYLERHIELHSGQASLEFFEDQTKKLEEELKLREEALKAFQTEHNIGDLDEHLRVLLEQEKELYLAQHVGEFDNSPALAAGAKAKVDALAKATEDGPKTVEISRTTGLTNYAADSLKGRLAELRLREADLTARFPDDYRPLVEIRDQIKSLDEALAAEEKTHTSVTTGIDAKQQALELALIQEEANLQAHMARQEILAEEQKKKNDEYAQLIALRLELDALERAVEVADAEYREYRENLQRARISSALDADKVSNVSVVQPATLPLHPARPNKRLNLAFGIVLGLALGLGWAFTINYFDDSLKTNEDIERRLGVPVLAAVSLEEFKKCI